ncbi:MAG: hypothetical protein JO342_07620 [Solirubrobacterales bacterium]|nr:hypothetical protein [Solirubrobacterales bacterium]MBV8942277.1 hypothetical protein [Solirubrobacterales bacterium]MBV9166006.1 hypothetical protein [Solirubrobacterales bacterium]
MQALLSRYHAHVRKELGRFGATVEKFIGDAVVALFAAPVAHEDDPERAVRAALAVRGCNGRDPPAVRFVGGGLSVSWAAESGGVSVLWGVCGALGGPARSSPPPRCSFGLKRQW